MCLITSTSEKLVDEKAECERSQRSCCWQLKSLLAAERALAAVHEESQDLLLRVTRMKAPLGRDCPALVW